MSIVVCEKCGQKNRVPAGKKVVCGRCKAALGGGGAPVTLSDASFAQALSASPLAVVDFWAAWCGPCRTIAPLIEELATERGDLLVGKLNVDENPSTSSRFRVSSIPTIVFFRNGEEAGRVVGAVDRGTLQRAVGQYLS